MVLPLESISDEHLQSFVEHIRSTALDGRERQLASASVKRTRAAVRAAFTSARKRRLIEWDRWDALEAGPLRDHDHVDRDIVMTSQEVREIARACGAISQRYECFVLIQGLCALRPREAVNVRRRDLKTAHGRPVAVTFASPTPPFPNVS